MISKRNDTIVAKKYYIGEYEYIDSVEANRIKEVTYISAPTGLVSAKVKIDDVVTNYFVLTDHLGSITQLLDSNGYMLNNAKFTYDAWGRLRDISKANVYDISSNEAKFHILDRGYTGHEHLLQHAIINMNGRIYDPVVGQFMQADNYIQTPEDYIGYNRYAYCRYNPFKFTDPSGEIVKGNGYITGVGGSGVMLPTEDDISGIIDYYVGMFHTAVKRCEEAADAVHKRCMAQWAIDEATGGGGATAPAGDAGTGGVGGEVVQTDDGVYLKGTPEEQAALADAINKEIDGVITYDEETGKITGWRANSGPENEPAKSRGMDEIRNMFDSMLFETGSQNSRVNIQFETESRSHTPIPLPGERICNLYIEQKYKSNPDGNWLSRIFDGPRIEDEMCHEMRHAQDWLCFGYQGIEKMGIPVAESRAIMTNNLLRTYYNRRQRSMSGFPILIDFP